MNLIILKLDFGNVLNLEIVTSFYRIFFGRYRLTVTNPSYKSIKNGSGVQ